jgi:hypothetical protein
VAPASFSAACDESRLPWLVSAASGASDTYVTYVAGWCS